MRSLLISAIHLRSGRETHKLFLARVVPMPKLRVNHVRVAAGSSTSVPSHPARRIVYQRVLVPLDGHPRWLLSRPGLQAELQLQSVWSQEAERVEPWKRALGWVIIPFISPLWCGLERRKVALIRAGPGWREAAGRQGGMYVEKKMDGWMNGGVKESGSWQSCHSWHGSSAGADYSVRRLVVQWYFKLIKEPL